MSGTDTKLPDLFKAFVAEQEAAEEEEDSIFGLGFSTPAGKGRMPVPRGQDEFISWAEVERFLQMAEQALRVRHARLDELERQLSGAQEQLEREVLEKVQVAKLEASASEDSSFLAAEVQNLMDERQALKTQVQQLEREREFLVQENRLLRQSLEGEGGEEVLSAARLQEELRAEQQRCLVLENEAIQLRARVSALERASQAQQCAMLSCIEESERVRLEQESGRLQQLHICGSPAALTDWALQLSCKSTEDSAYGGDDAASHASCLTPVAEGRDAAAAEEPDAVHGARQQQQQQQLKLSPPVLKPPPHSKAAAAREPQAHAAPAGGAAEA